MSPQPLYLYVDTSTCENFGHALSAMAVCLSIILRTLAQVELVCPGDVIANIYYSNGPTA